MTQPLDAIAKGFLVTVGNAARAMAKREDLPKPARAPAPRAKGPAKAQPTAPEAPPPLPTFDVDEFRRRMPDHEQAARLERLARSNAAPGENRAPWCAWAGAMSEPIKNRRQRYYAENREKVRERQRLYYLANRDAMRERQRSYYAENRERELERQHRFYFANREHILEQKRANRADRCNIALAAAILAEMRRNPRTRRRVARLMREVNNPHGANA
jgi:hypothetical protein